MIDGAGLRWLRHRLLRKRIAKRRWHRTGGRLRVPGNITLLRLPPYSPELNPVENVWAYLRGNKLSNRVFDTYNAIVDACCGAWNWLIASPERIVSIATRS